MYILVSTMAAWQAEVVLQFHLCCALFWFSLSLHLCFKAKVHCAAILYSALMLLDAVRSCL